MYYAQRNGRAPTPFTLTSWNGTEAAELPGGGVKARIDGGADMEQGAQEFTFQLSP